MRSFARTTKSWCGGAAALTRPVGAGAAMCAMRGLTYDVPAWVETLRTDAKAAESSISYDVRIYDEMAWVRKPYHFDKHSWDPNTLSTMLRRKLCLGDEFKEYTVIGEAFPFADRNDSPVVNEPTLPAKLLWDHTSKTDKIMIQLGEQFPPLLWHSVKPTLLALRKVFKEFLNVDAEHMKKYLPIYEQTQNRIETQHRETFGEELADFKMRDAFVEDMRRRHPGELSQDWDREHMVMLGTVEHFGSVEDKMMKSNPFVFGWPSLLSEGNHHLDGTPMRVAAFRSIYSKSLIMLHSRLDVQLDPRQFTTDDDDAVTLLEAPLFAHINYASNQRMCGGAALVQRFNRTLGTSYPDDMPVDILGAFAKEMTIKSVAEVRAEVAFLEQAVAKTPDIERTFRTAPQFSGHSKIQTQLAFALVNLALMSDPEIETVLGRFERHESETVRVGCAKAASLVERPDIVARIEEREPEGNAKRMMAVMRQLSQTTEAPPVSPAA
jgi:hypothetical protein